MHTFTEVQAELVELVGPYESLYADLQEDDDGYITGAVTLVAKGEGDYAIVQVWHHGIDGWVNEQTIVLFPGDVTKIAGVLKK